jgi:hypothetical protein
VGNDSIGMALFLGQWKPCSWYCQIPAHLVQVMGFLLGVKIVFLDIG